MFISDQEKENRIKNSEFLQKLNQSSDSNLEIRTKVRKEQVRIPEILRPVIGALGITSGVKKTAEEFGISPLTVSNISHGQMFWQDTRREVPELKDKVEAIVGRAQEAAAERLMTALGFITNEKLENAKARDLSGIAADMSRVIEKASPKSGPGIGPQIVIYAPSQKTEEHYDVIPPVK